MTRISRTTYYYDPVILPEEKRPDERNHQIIHALQTEVEGRLSTRPGLFDGKKILYTTVDLEFASGAQEARVRVRYSCRSFCLFFPLLFKYVVPMGHPPTGETDPQGQGSAYRVRLTRGPSVNPEYDTTVLLFP